jgi:peptide/nickel transport system ATP-binding protein
LPPLLSIQNLSIQFSNEGEKTIAVKNTSIEIKKGELVAIVGESGSGKSVTALSLLQLLPKQSIVKGKIIFFQKNKHPVNLINLTDKGINEIRGTAIAMIFQEPMTSLNPVFTCGRQVMEAIQLHQKVNAAKAKEKTIALFEKVKLPNPAAIINRYPHELSGGQKQRVMIAMAISCNPALLIADEPTTALDVTVQKTILELIKELQLQNNMGVILITHDLGVVADIADKIIVMYKGEIAEQGLTKEVLLQPQHPYTKALLACRPAGKPKGQRLPVVSDFMGEGSNGQRAMGNEQRTIGNEEAAMGNEQLVIGNEQLAMGNEQLALGNEEAAVGNEQRAMGNEQLAMGNEQSAKGNEQLAIKKERLSAVLEIENLKVYFPLKKKVFGKATQFFKAVDDISFKVNYGETLGLVGESGCGKTTLGRAILQLIPLTEGKIYVEGKDITKIKAGALRSMRKDLQIIFQDPYGSLNPCITIGNAILEPLSVHGILADNYQHKEKVIELLDKVNLLPDHFNRYPHQFSGGQRQRICIARALALNPSFLIFDESVSALDVSVQAQVLNLLGDLKKEFQFTSIFISHDLSVVRYISDRILVMHKGKIVEQGDAEQIYYHPQNEYTQKLIEAIPGKQRLNLQND